MTDEDACDLDETRRLLYAALACGVDHLNVPLYEKAELAGTIANALAHHRGGYEPEEALTLAISIISGVSHQKAWDLVKAITHDLESK